MQNPGKVQQAAQAVQNALSDDFSGAVGVVLGTGLGAWAKALGGKRIPYADIPGFPRSTVQSHAGELIAAEVNGRKVLALAGRFHLYEGYGPDEAVMGVRLLASLGASALVLTNAAGALDPRFDTGTLMVVTDHINATGHSPLTGPNHDPWGERFPDMSRVYSPRLVSLAMDKAAGLGVRVERGVYVQVSGPELETPAETRAYRRMGAHAIGMSTALEAVAAHHMGLEIMGISCLTNKNLPDCMQDTSLEEIIAQAEKSAGRLTRLLDAVVPQM